MVHFFRILYNILYVFAFLRKNANKNHNKSHSTHLLEWLKYKNKTHPLPEKKKKKTKLAIPKANEMCSN